jgi:hypothetical protein
MDEFNVNTPEGLKLFLLAEAELDSDLYSENLLRDYFKKNKTKLSDYYLMINCLKPVKA